MYHRKLSLKPSMPCYWDVRGDSRGSSIGSLMMPRDVVVIPDEPQSEIILCEKKLWNFFWHFFMKFLVIIFCEIFVKFLFMKFLWTFFIHFFVNFCWKPDSFHIVIDILVNLNYPELYLDEDCFAILVLYKFYDDIKMVGSANNSFWI